MFNLIRSGRSIFDDFFDDFPTLNKGGLMNTDIKEGEKTYIFEIDLPGFNKEDIKVSIKNNYLTIEAKKEKETESNDEKYIRRERSYGAYRRSYYVGNVGMEELNAKYENGILKIEVPKEPKEEETKYLDIK